MAEGQVREDAERLWAPWHDAAHALGFRRLEVAVFPWTQHKGAGVTVISFLYREPTFLDFSATMPFGHVPRGLHPGFGGAQFYTFAEGAVPQMILTNGIPADAPTGFLERLFHAPENLRDFRMSNGPADLPAVLDRHRSVIGASRTLIPAEPILEQRWRWMEELENSSME